MTHSCMFCDLVLGNASSHSVYETDTTLAFLDRFPVVDGHTMVIPKRHGETLLEYSPDELKDLWASVQHAARAIERAFDTNILTIGINHGEPGGVHHLHVHIIPRYETDGGGCIQSIVKRETSMSLEDIAKKIQREFKKRSFDGQADLP